MSGTAPSPKQLNSLARRLGNVINAMERERDRHATTMRRLEERLDRLYYETGAEVLTDV